ncbi:MAG TPA: hypothetical protein VFB66_05855 [Tepidisphaeraceae bacterium]|nr:hypothetical protein [Tepidisphaeraceae bacterium]
MTRVLLVLAVLFALPARAQDKSTFRSGAATSNVTPPLGASINGGMTDRKATHVHDELHARCLVLDDGKTMLAIAVVDSCMLPREVVDEAKRLIEQRTKIPPQNVLICATHAHSAPTAAPVFQSKPDPEYLKFLSVRVADGVQRAFNQLAPATVGWGVGRCPDHVFNRRWRMKPGTIPPDPFGKKTDQVQMNPPVASENLVEPAGPTDPEVWALSVGGPDGTPVALLANYALHYVGGVPGDHVSADYFGAFARWSLPDYAGEAEREGWGSPFVPMLANGASGNINNVDFRTRRPPKKPYEQLRLVARDVAEAAHGAMLAPRSADLTLAASTATLTLSVRKPTTEQVKRAEEIVAKAAGRELRSLPEVYAGETLALKDYPDTVELVLQVMRIGDALIFAIPCEVFVEIGLELKAKSPLKPASVFSLANGYNGYLPTPEHHKLGGYETWRAKSSYLEVDASPKIVAKLLELAEAVKLSP